MSFGGIWELLRPALLFALGCAALWALLRQAILRGKRRARREALYALTVFYLAALVEIIALRFGRPAARVAPQLVPLRTTLEQWRAGAWPFVYHVVGNLTWFMPLGLFLPMLRPSARWWQALLLGAGLSFLVEGYQWLFGTGTPDVDDVLLNALGALLGYGLCRLVRRVNVKSCGSA